MNAAGLKLVLVLLACVAFAFAVGFEIVANPSPARLIAIVAAGLFFGTLASVAP